MLILAPGQDTYNEIGIYFSSFSNMKVSCVSSLKSFHRGDSYEYTKTYHYQYKKENHSKSTLNIIMPVAVGLFALGTQ